MIDEHEEIATEHGFEFRRRAVSTDQGTATVAFLACEPLERAGFLNAFSTRLGGVSPLPSADLNLEHFKGDTKENVLENRRRFLKAIGAAPSAEIFTLRQTHSTDRVTIDRAADPGSAQAEGDGLIGKLDGVLIGVKTADCLPVLIADCTNRVVAAIHAGWRGTAGRIVERTIADLMTSHGVNPRNCIAALGPAACVECYEVGDDVIARYKKEFGYWRKLFANFKEGKAHLDVVAANLQQLEFCGFSHDRVFVAPYCTMHQNDLFFSYRREGRSLPTGVGRLLSVIGR
jgi:YfiH family protein